MFNLAILQDVKTGLGELSEGRLYPKFQQIPLVGRVRICLKVAAVAVACGIIANLIVGPFFGALFMVAGGVAAFSYFTLAYPMPDGWLKSWTQFTAPYKKTDTVFGSDYAKSRSIQEKFDQKKTSEGLAILFNIKEVTNLFDKEQYLKAFYTLMP
jgi:hypothetical protein